MRDVARTVQADARRRELLPEVERRLAALDSPRPRARLGFRLTMVGAAACARRGGAVLLRPAYAAAVLFGVERDRRRRPSGRGHRRTPGGSAGGCAGGPVLGRVRGDGPLARAGPRRRARRARRRRRRRGGHGRRLGRASRPDALGGAGRALSDPRDRHALFGRVGRARAIADRDHARGLGGGDGARPQGADARRDRAAPARQRARRRRSARRGAAGLDRGRRCARHVGAPCGCRGGGDRSRGGQDERGARASRARRPAARSRPPPAAARPASAPPAREAAHAIKATPARARRAVAAPQALARADADWRGQASHGQYREALASALHDGWRGNCDRLGVEDLMLLGDVARFAGDLPRADEAYAAARRRFPEADRPDLLPRAGRLRRPSRLRGRGPSVRRLRPILSPRAAGARGRGPVDRGAAQGRRDRCGARGLLELPARLSRRAARPTGTPDGRSVIHARAGGAVRRRPPRRADWSLCRRARHAPSPSTAHRGRGSCCSRRPSTIGSRDVSPRSSRRWGSRCRAPSSFPPWRSRSR